MKNIIYHSDGDYYTMPSENYESTIDDKELALLLRTKLNVLISGENIKTINHKSILGNGNLDIIGSTNSVGKIDQTSGAIAHGEIFNDYESNKAIEEYTHAEGLMTEASGLCSHAEGVMTEASGLCSHAEGEQTLSSGEYTHTEGLMTEASGYCSHAEGDFTKAIGDMTHTEGDSSKAHGYCSHAEGHNTETHGYYSHAEGEQTRTDNYGQHSLGLYNTIELQSSPIVYNPNVTLFSIGNGTSNNNRSDALKMLGNGTIWISGIDNFTGDNPTETNSLQAVLNNFKLLINNINSKIDDIALKLDNINGEVI